MRPFPTSRQFGKPQKSRRKINFFKWALLIPTVSTSAFHSTYLLVFSPHVPTNSVAPFSACKHTHNPQFLHSIWRRANARSVKKKNFYRYKEKLWNSLRWQIFVINSVVSTLLFLVKHLLSTWDFTTGQDSGESRFSDEGADPNKM